MPMIAQILAERQGLETSVAYARPTPATEDNIEGLEALADADLAVFFLRWRRLPSEQFQNILDYLHRGRPLVGLRTSTHSFNYPEGHPLALWNDGFGVRLFGQKWIRHHGHLSTTRVTVAAGAGGHPVLRGVPLEMQVPSWLYVVDPLVGDVEPLLIGHAVNPRNGLDYGPQPVAWVKTYNGARVFFTTLGHPDDFRQEGVRRLLVNGILWALGRDVPAAGADVRLPEPYDPPASGLQR
ncbi:MAG: hypothetical protein GC160_09640 [Acidobacteria bacterium]|nr:hypothetical protein [Acidobacteriota bacterium]